MWFGSADTEVPRIGRSDAVIGVGTEQSAPSLSFARGHRRTNCNSDWTKASQLDLRRDVADVILTIFHSSFFFTCVCENLRA